MHILSRAFQDYNQTKTTQAKHINNPKWQEVDQFGPYKCSYGDEQIQLVDRAGLEFRITGFQVLTSSYS